jgi:hypothetical protein
MELVKGTFFEVSGINCSIENPSFVTAVISVAQFRFSRPCTFQQKIRPCYEQNYDRFVLGNHNDLSIYSYTIQEGHLTD